MEVRKVSHRQGGWNRTNDPVRKLITGCVSLVLQQQMFQELVALCGDGLSVDSLTVTPFSQAETALRITFSDGRTPRYFSVRVKEHQSTGIRT